MKSALGRLSLKAMEDVEDGLDAPGPGRGRSHGLLQGSSQERIGSCPK